MNNYLLFVSKYDCFPYPLDMAIYLIRTSQRRFPSDWSIPELGKQAYGS